MIKADVYRTITEQVSEVVGELDDPVAIMASTAAILHQAIPYSSWTGFYRVVEDRLLRVGPYQGPLGCLEIDFDRGVCGAAASRRQTVLVPDVHAFPGHVVCDSKTESEIVVPVIGRSGDLVAVLDLDSHAPAAFDEEDRLGLEAVADVLRSVL